MTAQNPACARVQERLAQLLDHDLAPLEEARDLGHLEACPACRALEAEHVRLLKSLPRAWSAGLEAEAARLAAAVRRELARAPRPRPRWRLVPDPVLAAAVAAGLLLLLRLWPGVERMGLSVPQDPVPLDPLLERLPSWSELRAGLGQLTRWVS